MSFGEVLGLVSTILGITGVIVGVAVHLATSPLKSENSKLQWQIQQITENQAKLVESLALIKTTSSEAQNLKAEIDKELKLLAQMVGVSSASILVPYPPGQNSRLAFLSILGPEASKLKHVYVNVNSSIAGEVYLTHQSVIVNDMETDKKWNPTADKRTAFTTNNLLCVPLRSGDTVIGVAQFLNKSDAFVVQDRDTLEKAIMTLVFHVGKFVQQVDNFEILGLGYAQNIEDGTVVFIDLSSSSSLLRGAHPLPKADVIGIINEYLEKLTTIAAKNGCIVDKYMWDGCLFSLNVANSIPDHKLVAYRTALEMHQRFEELKASWKRAGYPVEQLFCRIVLTCGPILQVDMGPAQFRQKTIVGDPVVAASALSADAPRDRNVILVDQAVFNAISSDHIKAQKVSPDKLGKARGLISNAYQIELVN
jgi:class 3 adenylate cyclase